MSLPTPVLRKTNFSSSFSSRRTKPLSLCVYLFTEAKLKAFLFLASPASFEQSGRPISAAKLFGTTRNLRHLQILRSRMALRGVWQLQKLIVNYCDWGGSSRGIRAFMESQLPVFREKNPQLEVVTELIRGQHPLLKGLYKNRSERVICVKNMDPEEILQHATRLRNSLGRKVVKLRTRHVTHHPSVQGTWTTDVKF